MKITEKKFEIKEISKELNNYFNSSSNYQGLLAIKYPSSSLFE